MIFTADHHPVWLADTYMDRTAFLICSGPSFSDDQRFPKELLRQPGIITMGLNNSPKVFRPNLWCSVDDPTHWIRSIWLDPLIQKFVPICHTQKRLFDSDAWKEMDMVVSDCPNVFYYKRNEHFKADQFLWEDTFNWGNHKKYGGGRSIMLVAIRLLYYLGFRRVFLLGVDFEMKPGQQNYAFEQDRHKGSIDGNNATYRLMMERFTQLKPYFEQEGFEVFNCNDRSALSVFPHVPYEKAVEEALLEFGNGRLIDIPNERTEGLYDREYKLKQEKEKQAQKLQAVEARAKSGNYSDDDRQEVKDRLDVARAALDTAKNLLRALEQKKLPSNATPAAKKQHAEALAAAEKKVHQRRVVFRTIEDEKRLKWGEPARWGLWSHGQQSLHPGEGVAA